MRLYGRFCNSGALTQRSGVGDEVKEDVHPERRPRRWRVPNPSFVYKYNGQVHEEAKIL